MNQMQAMYQAGYQAAKSNKLCVPALCSKYQAAVAGMKVGMGAASLAQAWMEGHSAANSEAMAA